MGMFMAVDVGGTQLRAAIYPCDSWIPLRVERIPTKDPSSSPLERLEILIKSIWPVNEPVIAIGVAAPGTIDPYQGVLVSVANIPGWENLPLRQILEDQFQTKVGIGNDANLAALGEWQYGAGKGHHNMVYLTISTGIGGGVIINDRLLLGHRGLATELGHIVVMQDGPLCSCGKRGHLEAVASGPSIVKWVEQQLSQGFPSDLTANKNLNTKIIANAALQGDALAIQALARAGNFIGQSVANLLHIFNPTAVILGGGVVQSGPLLMEPLRAAMEENAMSPDYYTGLLLTTAALGDDAGLTGALALAHNVGTKPTPDFV
jgi:glucokinase